MKQNKIKNILITIPIMTHPLSKAWDQPSSDRMLIDDECAIMDEKTVRELAEYSMSVPTGVYEGKMWRSFYKGEWYLNWWDVDLLGDPNKCSHKQRLIIVI